MRTKIHIVIGAFLFCLAALPAFGIAPQIEKHPQSPPTLPLPAVIASRGAMLPSAHWIHAQSSNGAGSSTNAVFLPLSPGLTMISVPVHTESIVLSDMLQNLPAGSRVWEWDPTAQQFAEGFNQQLPLGQGALLYVPAPTVMMVKGDEDLDSEVPVDLHPGWNLIGVPYPTPMARSSQDVFVESVRTAFNDAVDNGNLGPSVYSLDQRGEMPVGDDDSFQPMNAYWVYSNDADLLELHPPPDNSGSLVLRGNDAGGWVAGKIGNFAFQFAAGTLMEQIFGRPDANVLTKLDDVSRQIQGIQNTLTAMETRLNTQFQNLARQLATNQAELRKAMGDGQLVLIRSNLDTHYTGKTENDSLGYYLQQVQTVDGEPDGQRLARINAIDPNGITRFNQRVLDSTAYHFINDFNTVAQVIAPPGDKGVVDYLADAIIARGAVGATGEDAYAAMQSYFDDLIGLQIQQEILICNAYEQLAKVPGSGVTAGAADRFRQNTFTPKIQAEAERFRSAVERVIVSRVQVAKTLADRPVFIPNEINNIVLPKLDFRLMQLLNEAGGLRVRALVSPDNNPTDTYRIAWQVGGGRGQGTLNLPSTDSGQWSLVGGSVPYDSWRLSPTQNIPEFFATSNWLLFKTMLPIPNGTVLARLTDSLSRTDQTPRMRQQFAWGNVDANGNPAAGGTPFGSVILTNRPTADTMLHIPAGSNEQFTYPLGLRPCNPNRVLTSGVDFLAIQGCGNAFADFSTSMRFLYSGSGPASGPATISVSFGLVGDLGQSWARATMNGVSATAAHWEQNRELAGEQTATLTWQPGQTYELNLSLEWGSRLVYTTNYWPERIVARRGAILLRFN